MRKQNIENAAYDLATQVRAVEDSIDETLAEIAELQARMVRARSAMGIGVATGHAAFEKIVGANQALVGARGEIADCHAALVEAKGRVPGLRTVGFGDADQCPKPGGSLDLRVVA
jgi:uncharacterized protein (DUF1501 family)